MAAVSGALIPPTANTALERTFRARIEQRRSVGGTFGELESLALRIGLIQNSASPELASARLIVFAADHGSAVDDIGGPSSRSTVAMVDRLLEKETPVVALAHAQGIELNIVDAGVAERLAHHPRLLTRKIAHGTRNSRLGPAMSTEQAHAAMRAGMEIGHQLSDSAVACAGIGSGSLPSAALLLSCLSGAPVHEFVDFAPEMAAAFRKNLLRVLEEGRARHGHLHDPVMLLAAVGGFEVAMMTGLMLSAASRRRVVIADGLGACAAWSVASEIAPALGDYCFAVRSSPSAALDRAFAMLATQPVQGVGIDSVDGTGATLAWPLLRAAAALVVAPPQPGGSNVATRSDRVLQQPTASQQ
ncbi:MAG: nicotinate-nucleotide--dimethylbenzimidazole phosphoribosyltransferase [Caldimonas sp.]